MESARGIGSSSHPFREEINKIYCTSGRTKKNADVVRPTPAPPPPLPPPAAVLTAACYLFIATESGRARLGSFTRFFQEIGLCESRLSPGLIPAIGRGDTRGGTEVICCFSVVCALQKVDTFLHTSSRTRLNYPFFILASLRASRCDQLRSEQ